MNFTKTSEHIIRPESASYFLVREFHYDKYSPNPITDFMRTPYFCWNEEYRNEVKVSIDNEPKIVDWNFHGLYDIKKLKPEHFKEIGFQEFTECIKNYIVSKIGLDPKLSEIETYIDGLFNLNSDYFIIQDLTDDFFHDWTVFEFFLSGFIVNTSSRTLIAIEFGLD